jgi:GNAT superfamily N-acetyltransferase
MASVGSSRIEPVGAGQTYALRHLVLRPHQGVIEMGFPGDDDPASGHFAAFDATGEVIGVATVLPQTSPNVPEPGSLWRLRGMAIAPGHRGQGTGRALLAVALAHTAAHGGTVLWCHARLAAVPFYRRGGFETAGDLWEEPVIGPHLVMWRRVPPGT